MALPKIKKFLSLPSVILATAILLLAFKYAGMKRNIRMNHLAIYVRDLQQSTRFYQDVIGLDTIPEPFHDGRHTWFNLGNTSQLHVISGAYAATVHDKNNHLCFSVDNVNTFIQALDKNAIAYEDWAGKPQSVTLRVDGVKQIWFRDLDGYWIEINDAKD